MQNSNYETVTDSLTHFTNSFNMLIDSLNTVSLDDVEATDSSGVIVAVAPPLEQS